MTPHRNGATTSLWMATAPSAPRPPLEHDADVDVCVVGAGIAGLTVAYRLAQAGRSVVLLDEHAPGRGQTGRTSAHLSNALDDRYYHLRRLHGADGARLAAASHTAAIDTIEALCHREGVECAFERVDGYLVQGEGSLRAGELDREYEAARDAGLDVERVPGAPGAWGVFGEALRFRHQAQFHPLHYIEGLARAFERHGGRLHGQTRVTSVHDGSTAGVETAHGPQVRARDVVVATNTPFNDRVALHTKQAAYRTYVLAMPMALDAIEPVLLWDTLDPYHYVRTARIGHRQWLIVGGADHKTGQDEDPAHAWDELESWTRHHFAMAGPVAHRWSGQVYEPVDSLAFIGRNPGDDHVYIATGDSGNGLTHGTIAGLLIGQQILGDETPWQSLYSPTRINPRSTDEYLRENLNMVAQYRELFTGSEVDSLDMIAKGSGAIVRDGLGKRAVYRAEDGQFYVHSATCPHLGGIVRWNAAECSWDCPVHGSRFDARDGRCLNGPAAHGLAPLDPQAADDLAGDIPANLIHSRTPAEHRPSGHS